MEENRPNVKMPKFQSKIKQHKRNWRLNQKYQIDTK